MKIRRPSKHTTVFWIWNATLDASTCPQTLVFARQTIRRSDSLESFQSQIMCRAQSRSICQNCTPVAFNLPSYSIAAAHGGQCLIESRSRAIRAGQSVIDVNPVGRDAQFYERSALSGEILLIGRAASVANECFGHWEVYVSGPAREN